MAGLSRVVDQNIGASLQQLLLPSAQYPITAAGHIGKIPGGTGGPAGGLATPQDYTLIAAAQSGSDYLVSGGKFLHLVIDVTAINGATLTVSILGVDPVSGKSYVILASAGLVASATTVLKVGPGLTAAANVTANDFIPLYWGVGIVIATAAPTFSIAAMQMP